MLSAKHNVNKGPHTQAFPELDVIPALVVEVYCIRNKTAKDGDAGDGEDGRHPRGHGGGRWKVCGGSHHILAQRGNARHASPASTRVTRRESARLLRARARLRGSVVCASIIARGLPQPVGPRCVAASAVQRRRAIAIKQQTAWEKRLTPSSPLRPVSMQRGRSSLDFDDAFVNVMFEEGVRATQGAGSNSVDPFYDVWIDQGM